MLTLAQSVPISVENTRKYWTWLSCRTGPSVKKPLAPGRIRYMLNLGKGPSPKPCTSGVCQSHIKNQRGRRTADGFQKILANGFNATHMIVLASWNLSATHLRSPDPTPSDPPKLPSPMSLESSKPLLPTLNHRSCWL